MFPRMLPHPEMQLKRTLGGVPVRVAGSRNRYAAVNGKENQRMKNYSRTDKHTDNLYAIVALLDSSALESGLEDHVLYYVLGRI